MSQPAEPRQSVPLWLTILVAACALPAAAWPWLAQAAAPGAAAEIKALVWAFPAYVILSALVAWLCMAYSRRLLGWIILALMLLSEAAFWVLATCVR